MKLKLQNNGAWIAHQEEIIKHSDEPDRSILFVLLTTPGGGNEYRPWKLLHTKLIPENPRFFAKKKHGKSSYLEIDPEDPSNRIDWEYGTVRLPFTPKSTQHGAFPDGIPNLQPPCPGCGWPESSCHCFNDEPSAPPSPPQPVEYI